MADEEKVTKSEPEHGEETKFVSLCEGCGKFNGKLKFKSQKLLWLCWSCYLKPV